MSAIKRYWQCEFKNKKGESVWKMIIADTPRQAIQQVFETSRYFGFEPKYETLRYATEKEVRDLKKTIKKRVKEKMNIN